MKKLISTILAIALLSISMISCAPNVTPPTTPSASTPNSSSPEAPTTPSVSKLDAEPKLIFPLSPEKYTRFTTEGKETKLVGDPNATGELNIARNLFTDPEYPSDQDAQFDLTVEKFKELYPNVKLNIALAEIDPENPADPKPQGDFIDKIEAEIMAGKGPDLFWGNISMDLVKMAQGGAFADLTEFFENDKNFNAQDYNERVLYSGQVDGKQYFVPTRYSVPVLLTTQSLLDEGLVDKTKFSDFYSTMDELINLYAKNEKPNSPNSPIYGTYSLEYNMQHCGLNIADYSNKKVNIDTPEVKKALEVQKKFVEVRRDLKFAEAGVPKSTAKGIVDRDSKMVINNAVYNLLEPFNTAREIKALGQEPAVLPIRNVRGNITAYVENDIMSVSNNSKNKQNAYNFLKIYISPEIQSQKGLSSESSYMTPFPISNQACKIVLEEMKKDGEIIAGDISVKLSGLSNEFMDEYFSYFDEIDSVSYHSKLDQSFESKVQPYIKGEKAYDECIKSAQDALNIYISE